MPLFFLSAALAVFLLVSPRLSAMEDGEEENYSSESGDRATDSSEASTNVAGEHASQNASIMSDNRSEQESSSTKVAADTPRKEPRSRTQSRFEVYDYFDKETPDLNSIHKKTAKAHNEAHQLNEMAEYIYPHGATPPNLSGLEEDRGHAIVLHAHWKSEYEQYNRFLEEARGQISTRTEEELEAFLSASYGAWQAAEDFLKQTYPLSLSRLPRNSEGRVLAWTAYQERQSSSSEDEGKVEEIIPMVRKYALKKEPAARNPYLKSLELKEREAQEREARNFFSFSERPPSRKEPIHYPVVEAKRSLFGEQEEATDQSSAKALLARVDSSIKIRPAAKGPPGTPRPSLKKLISSFFQPKNQTLENRKKFDSLEGLAWRKRMKELNNSEEDLSFFPPDEGEK